MKTLLLVAWISSCSADAATTHIALNRGAHEMLLTQNPYANTLIMAGEAGAGLYAIDRGLKSHPKLTKVLFWTVTGIRIAAVVNNVHQLQKMPR